MSEHGHKFNESADIFNEIAEKSHGHAIKSRGVRGLFAEDRGSLLPGAYGSLADTVIGDNRYIVA